MYGTLVHVSNLDIVRIVRYNDLYNEVWNLCLVTGIDDSTDRKSICNLQDLQNKTYYWAIICPLISTISITIGRKLGEVKKSEFQFFSSNATS